MNGTCTPDHPRITPPDETTGEVDPWHAEGDEDGAHYLVWLLAIEQEIVREQDR